MCQACGFADIVHGSQMRRRAFVFGAAMAGALTVVGSARAGPQIPVKRNSEE